MYTYKYPKADVTADFVLFRLLNDEVQVLLIQRSETADAFPGCWALPGGFLDLDKNETSKEAAIREIREETGVALDDFGIHYVGVFDKPDRDPRGRVISHVYTAISASDVELKAGDDAAKAQWFPCIELPRLAFDHADVIREAWIKALRIF